MLALLVAAAALAPPPCAADTSPALQLTGVPAVAIPGRTYEAALAGEGPVVDTAGSDIGVTDTSGRGWSAHYQSARGVSQAFSVGIDRAPFTVTASWTEPVGDATCLRTVTVPLPIERRILALVNCRRGVAEPRSGLVLRCRSDQRLRLSGLRWSRWNADTTVGRGKLAGRDATVTLSAPRECSALSAIIYTRAKVTSGGRTIKRIPIACPLPST
jgi:hypothetical protein